MRLVRSADEVDGGTLMDVQELWELAVLWYGDRLDPEWRPRTRDESQRLLADVGLDDEFWELP
jgi:hypothetical protein